MKKIKILSRLLCLTLLFSSLTWPVLAAETQPEQTQTEPSETTIPPVSEMPFGTVCVYNGCHSIEGMVPLAGSDRMLDTAQSAFLFETSTQTVVYSYNPDVKVAPGGLTKLVNAAVVMEHAKLDDVVTLNNDIYRLPENARHYDFKPDEEVTVETLLYCMLCNGANDAAVGLADYVAGNQVGFLKLMNEWVQRIGCTSTEFGNIHGLSNATSTTTARDMVKIMMAVMENEDLKTILSSMSYKMPATNLHPIEKDEDQRSFRTQNYMIDKGTIEEFYDARVKGGFQSYEDVFGASAVVWANDVKESSTTAEETTATEATEATEETNPGDIPILTDEEIAASKNKFYIAVVMGCVRTFDPDRPWKPISYGNFNELTKLIKTAFSSYKVNRIVYDGMVLDQVSVPGGECNVVGQATVNIDSVVPAAAQMDNIYKSFTAKDGLKAPIQAGEKIGTIQLTYRNAVMAEAEVFAAGSVTVAGDNGVSIRSTATRSDAGGSGVWSTIGTIVVVIIGLAAAYLTFNAYMRAKIRARRRQQRADRRRTR